MGDYLSYLSVRCKCNLNSWMCQLGLNTNLTDDCFLRWCGRSKKEFKIALFSRIYACFCISAKINLVALVCPMIYQWRKGKETDRFFAWYMHRFCGYDSDELGAKCFGFCSCRMTAQLFKVEYCKYSFCFVRQLPYASPIFWCAYVIKCFVTWERVKMNENFFVHMWMMLFLCIIKCWVVRIYWWFIPSTYYFFVLSCELIVVLLEMLH